MQSDRRLRNWYLKYNKLYFNGELPEHTILYWEPTPNNDAVCCPVYEVTDGCFEIKIDPAIKGEPGWWKITLLHEMIHVKLWKKHPKHRHGKLFEDEKHRLYALGALRKLW